MVESLEEILKKYLYSYQGNPCFSDVAITFIKLDNNTLRIQISNCFKMLSEHDFNIKKEITIDEYVLILEEFRDIIKTNIIDKYNNNKFIIEF